MDCIANISSPLKTKWLQNSVYENAIIERAYKIILNIKRVLLPQYKDSTSLISHELRFTKILLIDKKSKRIKLKVFHMKKGTEQSLYIIILNGIKLSNEEKKHIIKNNEICLVFDISSLTLQDIKEQIFLEDFNISEWINNPIYDEYYKNKKKKLLEKWEKQCKEAGYKLKKHSQCTYCCNSYKIKQSLKKIFKDYPERVLSAKNIGIDIESISYEDFCNGNIKFKKAENIIILRGKVFHSIDYNTYNLFSCLSNYKNRALHIKECGFLKLTYKEEGLDYIACNANESDILNYESGINYYCCPIKEN